MYVRIVRPPPKVLGSYDISGLQMHCAYEVTAPLGDLLIMHGFAIIERRLGAETPLPQRRKPKPPRA
jgi:hypothetical protein